MKEKGKRDKRHANKIIKCMLSLLVIVFLSGIAYIIYYFSFYNNQDKQNENALNDIEIDNKQITETKTERMLQVEELQKENSDIMGWIEIKDTNINYPVVQGADNDFYLTHNYKKEKYINGSLFLDKDFDLKNGNSNYLIYGHRNKKGLSKEEVCRRVQLHGVYIHRVELYRMEKGISIIKDFELIALCKVLDIDYNNEIANLVD